VDNQDNNDSLDHVIESLESSLATSNQTMKKRRKKSSSKNPPVTATTAAPSPSINIKEFLDLEAEESPKKSQTEEITEQKTKKIPKVWSPGESVCLKILVKGCVLLGRNVSGLTAALNKELREFDPSYQLTTKEVKNKLETKMFLDIKPSTPVPSSPVPSKSVPAFDDVHPVLHSKYEAPYFIDTNSSSLLLVWPNCDGRDVDVTIQGDYLNISIKKAPLMKHSQQYLVESNCGEGTLVKNLTSPPLEVFQYPLPHNVAIGGTHEILQDPSGLYYGIKLQKKTEFSKKSMVVSARTKEINMKEMLEEEQKIKLAQRVLDEEAQYTYCKRMVEMMESKKLEKELKEKEMSVEHQSDFAEDVNPDDAESESDNI